MRSMRIIIAALLVLAIAIGTKIFFAKNDGAAIESGTVSEPEVSQPHQHPTATGAAEDGLNETAPSDGADDSSSEYPPGRNPAAGPAVSETIQLTDEFLDAVENSGGGGSAASSATRSNQPGAPLSTFPVSTDPALVGPAPEASGSASAGEAPETLDPGVVGTAPEDSGQILPGTAPEFGDPGVQGPAPEDSVVVIEPVAPEDSSNPTN